ncbi:MAG: NAD(P)/FAD-dependent oxidoreductase [Acetobacteraceae bacterium]|nr:NAD(P)/FAD-dependent oxidoreductase [Acetobacteraceae bacterium]
MTIGLEALARRAQDEMDLFAHPAKPWVTPRRGPGGEVVRDVVVIGAGQSGLGIAHALQRERIDNFEVLDAADEGQEGPWITTARMITLRTLKFLTGPDLGVPSLTYRAWHEAQWGRRSYEQMARIPKEEWMRYLVWLKETLRIPVRNGVRLVRIGPGETLTLHLETEHGPERLLARKLVIATGIEGAGRRRVPAFVREALPQDRWANTADEIDFEHWRGRRVVVVGAGASAFDNAAAALEAGAATVDILIRRPELPRVNAFRVLETRGFFRNFGDAPDADRWRFMQRMLSLPMPPPDDTVARVRRHANARIRVASPLLDVAAAGDEIRVRTPSGWDRADFLILGTGYGVDLATRPELADLAPHVATWADRYTPPDEEQDPAVARYPYLGPGFQLTEREPGTAPGLANIHLFTVGAMVSMGPIAGGLNGMPWGVPRLIGAISRDLFMPELDRAFAEFRDYEEDDPWEAVKAAE